MSDYHITTVSLIQLRALISHMKEQAEATLPTFQHLDILDALDRITTELERIEQREMNK